LEAALEAYGAALERSPAMRDALHNRSLVREALAKQRAQAEAGGQSQAPAGAEARASPAAPGAASRPRRRDAAWDEPGRPEAAQARDRPQATAQAPEEGPEAAELRRLEELLAQVPDDPGSLLANRFAHQLRLRGTPHRDTGARW
jgi:hypothetical protein